MTTPTTRIVVVTDPQTGHASRLNLSYARDLGLDRRDWSTGIDLAGAYLMPRAQRVIVEWFSRWDRGNGRTRGSYFEVADNDLIARLAQEFDCVTLALLLPEFVDACNRASLAPIPAVPIMPTPSPAPHARRALSSGITWCNASRPPANQWA